MVLHFKFQFVSDWDSKRPQLYFQCEVKRLKLFMSDIMERIVSFPTPALTPIHLLKP